jgi:hypothetical protein
MASAYPAAVIVTAQLTSEASRLTLKNAILLRCSVNMSKAEDGDYADGNERKLTALRSNGLTAFS